MKTWTIWYNLKGKNWWGSKIKVLLNGNMQQNQPLERSLMSLIVFLCLSMRTSLYYHNPIFVGMFVRGTEKKTADHGDIITCPIALWNLLKKKSVCIPRCGLITERQIVFFFSLKTEKKIILLLKSKKKQKIGILILFSFA